MGGWVGGEGWGWMSDSANYQSDVDLTIAARVYAFPGFGINVFISTEVKI